MKDVLVAFTDCTFDEPTAIVPSADSLVMTGGGKTCYVVYADGTQADLSEEYKASGLSAEEFTGRLMPKSLFEKTHIRPNKNALFRLPLG